MELVLPAVHVVCVNLHVPAIQGFRQGLAVTVTSVLRLLSHASR